MLALVQSVLRAMVLTGAMVTVPGQEESVKMQILTLTLATETATSVRANASTNTSPAMGHVMKMMDTIDTNAGASVFTVTCPVSVEQSH